MGIVGLWVGLFGGSGPGSCLGEDVGAFEGDLLYWEDLDLG
jgi:hypothetical protein